MVQARLDALVELRLTFPSGLNLNTLTWMSLVRRRAHRTVA